MLDQSFSKRGGTDLVFHFLDRGQVYNVPVCLVVGIGYIEVRRHHETALPRRLRHINYDGNLIFG